MRDSDGKYKEYFVRPERVETGAISPSGAVNVFVDTRAGLSSVGHSILEGALYYSLIGQS